MNGPDYQNVVLRFLNGELEKRKIFRHVSLTANTFKAITREGKVEEVPYDALKAVFYVKELDGNKDYHDRKDFSKDSPRTGGKKAEVLFKDGEKLKGTVPNYDKNKKGFFLIPADPMSNDEKVFAVFSAVEEVKFLDE